LEKSAKKTSAKENGYGYKDIGEIVNNFWIKTLTCSRPRMSKEMVRKRKNKKDVNNFS